MGARRQQRRAGPVPAEAVPGGLRERLLGDLARELGRPRGRRGQGGLPQHGRDLVGVAVLARRRPGGLDAGHGEVALAAGGGTARELGGEAVDHVGPGAGGDCPPGLGLERRDRVPVVRPGVREQAPPQDQQPGRGRHPERRRQVEHGLRLVQAGAVAAGVGEHERAVAAAEGLHHEGLLDLDRLDPREAVADPRRRLGEAPLGVVEVVAAHHLGAGRQQRQLAPAGRGERLIHQGLGLRALTPDGVGHGHDHAHEPGRRPGARDPLEVPLGGRHAHRRAHPHREGGELGSVEGGRGPLRLARRHQPADGLVPALEGGGRVAGEVREECVGQLDARVRPPGLGRDALQPPGERLALGRRHHRLGHLLESPRGGVRVPGLELVPHRLLVVAGRLPGARGARVQHGQAVGLALGQAPAEERLEEVVVAEPVALGLDDEQVGGHEAADHLRGVGALGNRRRQRRREALEHRGVEQEALQVGRQAGEHLLGEVVELGADRDDLLGRAGAGAGAGGQQKARHPALGALVQLPDLGLARAAGRVLQQLGGLLEAEGQHVLAHHGGAGRGDPRGRDRQVAAAGHGQVDVRGEVRREQAQGLEHRPIAERVHVVERQDEVVGDRLEQLVRQGGDLVLGRPARRQGRGDARERPRHAGRDVGDEHLGCPQARVAGEPHRRHRRRLEGLDEQGGLAVTGPRHERRQAALQAEVHARHQLRPRHAVGGQPRGQEAGAQNPGR